MKYVLRTLALGMALLSTSAVAGTTRIHSMQDLKRLSSSTPVMVYVYAKWCGACKAFKPTMDRFITTRSDTPVVIVDYDTTPWFTYSIKALPTTLIVQNGKIADIKVGTVPYATLDNMVPAPDN